MTAIITPKFSVFFDISRDDRFFADSKWVYNKETCYGYDFDSYFLSHRAEEIKDINEIINCLEARNIKRIYE